MAKYTVSYTSERDGITVGVMADSYVEALSVLVEEFGEGVVPMFEHTRKEFQDLTDSVSRATGMEDSDAQEHHQASPDEPGATGGSSEGIPPGESATASGAAPGRAPGADPGSEADQRGDQGGAPAPPDDHEPPPASEHRCDVCGVPITADRAAATRLMQGEERCADCTP